MIPRLSDHQVVLLRCSGFDPKDGNGYGVEIRGASEWRTARSLERLGLGWIENGYANGSNLPALFFANDEGTALTHPVESRAWQERRFR